MHFICKVLIVFLLVDSLFVLVELAHASDYKGEVREESTIECVIYEQSLSKAAATYKHWIALVSGASNEREARLAG